MSMSLSTSMRIGNIFYITISTSIRIRIGGFGQAVGVAMTAHCGSMIIGSTSINPACGISAIWRVHKH